MKKGVWVAADCIVSPLGNTTEENYERIRSGESGIREISDLRINALPFYGAQCQDILPEDGLTRFETLCMLAIRPILAQNDIDLDSTLLILSTTKGNIDLLDTAAAGHPRLDLHASASHLASLAGIKKSLVISNACISGLMAILVAKRLLEAGRWQHVLVLGADEMNRFVVSGFQSLQAMSDGPCRPFDSERKGINLGEAAAAMLLTSQPGLFVQEPVIRVSGGGMSNDANHISAPSRSGVELANAVRQAVQEAGIQGEDIDFISAHGTATMYNDEMEAKAFQNLGMQNIPLNSLKGYFGHTLGAAGVLESIICCAGLKSGEMIPTLGFSQIGVSGMLNVTEKLRKLPARKCLKTASGFGGCNAALILSRERDKN